MEPTERTLPGLLDAIRTAAGQPALDWAEPPRPLTGGFWAEMWWVRLTCAREGLDGELVARVMPSADVGARETAIQSHLADAGFPTPIVRLAGEPGPDLGRAWMLMDHVPGRPLLADLSGPAALRRLPRLARSLPDRLALHAAELHRIEPDASTIGGSDTVSDFNTHLRDQTHQLGRVDLAALADWLRRTRPSGGRLAICHGDLHPLNILTDPGGDTVLDWSTAQITDPAYDIAFTRLLLGNPPLRAPPFLQPAILVAGKGLSRRFMRTYERLADTPVSRDQLAWFTVLHALRILTEVATWHARGELDQRSTHPFLAIVGSLERRVERTTGIRVDRESTAPTQSSDPDRRRRR